MSHIPQQQPETSGGKRGTSKLGNPISRHPSPRKVADQCEGEGHCRVEVCATDVPKGIDHHGDDEAKNQPNSNMGHLSTRKRVDHDGSTASKDQTKCPNAFCHVGSPLLAILCPASFRRGSIFYMLFNHFITHVFSVSFFSSSVVYPFPACSSGRSERFLPPVFGERT